MRIIDRVWSFIPANVVTYLAAYYHALTHVELITKPVDGAWLFRSGGPWSFPGGVLAELSRIRQWLHSFKKNHHLRGSCIPCIWALLFVNRDNIYLILPTHTNITTKCGTTTRAHTSPNTLYPHLKTPYGSCRPP